MLANKSAQIVNNAMAKHEHSGILPAKKDSTETLEANLHSSTESGNFIEPPRDGIIKGTLRSSARYSSSECASQVMDELEDVIKHTPSPSKMARNNPSSLGEPGPQRPVRENSAPANGVQAMSPNIKQVSVIDDVSEDSIPGAQEKPPTMSSSFKHNRKIKSFARYAQSEESCDEAIFDGVNVHDFMVSQHANHSLGHEGNPQDSGTVAEERRRPRNKLGPRPSLLPQTGVSSLLYLPSHYRSH